MRSQLAESIHPGAVPGSAPRSVLRAGSVSREVLAARLLPAVVACVLLAYLFAGIKQAVNAYDEGFALYGALRVLHGEVPYRDFWTVYAPGQFYVLAGLFQLFGTTVLVERVWDTLARAAVVLGVYLVTATLTTRRAALWPALLVTLWVAAAEYYGYAVFPALALVLGGAWCLLRYAAGAPRRWLVASGGLVGLATLFRHDVGLYAVASLGIVCLLLALTGRARRPATPRGWLRALVEVPGLFTLGVLAALLPLAAYLIVVVPPAALWRDLVLYPLTLHRDISALPYPPLVPKYLPVITSANAWSEYTRDVLVPWALFYGPLLVYGSAAVLLVWQVVRADSKTSRAHSLSILLLLLLGLTLFNQALNRFDRLHVLPSATVAASLLTVLLARLRPGRARPVLLLAATPLIILATIAYVVVPVQAYLTTVWRFSPLVCHASAPRSGCIDLYVDQERAYAYTQAQTAPDERIFVGTTRHDRASGSDVIYYFLAERPSATRYHELVAGVSTTLPVQQEIVADLERHRVRHVVLTSAFDGVQEPNQSRLSSGVTLLDAYIWRHFQPTAGFGVYTIWERRDD
jgi:hypothetical protein